MELQFKSCRWPGPVMAALAVMIVLVGCAGIHFPCEPIISLTPASGGPGTRVVVTGSGFPAATLLAVRLGPPDIGATPQTYGQALSDATGRLQLAFEMPARWPDGSPVSEAQIIVVILNEDGSIKAVAPFSFRPDPSPTPG